MEIISGKPKFAFSLAIKKSQEAAIAKPAPRAGPFIAPITGTAHS